MLNIEEIQKILPHRPPFLLIDRIEELEVGKRAVGRKCVTMNEPFFQGHFPGKAVMPGVLILEALAQTGAVVMLSVEANKGKIAYFGGMDRVKFKRQVVPGDVLTLEVEIIKNKGSFGVGKALATVDGKVAVEAELTFAIG
jgi:3-hydroxyacyl-[acyl-carrier-protein] dehydratase